MFPQYYQHSDVLKTSTTHWCVTRCECYNNIHISTGYIQLWRNIWILSSVSSIFSRNSEEFASEFLENIEDIFLRHYIVIYWWHSNLQRHNRVKTLTIYQKVISHPSSEWTLYTETGSDTSSKKYTNFTNTTLLTDQIQTNKKTNRGWHWALLGK